ncbi:S-4TM family putative pore-forming effector [Pasteurella multocida]|uniref:S-4TM family putative pore-forming effector n=1 Tax=Pasteurella multocida TaxID=747 RepID=UPI002BC3EC3D|nr:S-4TM family putative pore-forming effector [Pasteurella multocida]MEB3454719.1 S-4TM family putative pore-forming effector [Pasteurella multocida]
MVDILREQNKEWALNKLIAQRATYSKAKKIRIISVVVIIISLFIEALNFMSFIKIESSLWVSIFATILILINLVLEKWSNSIQEKAAKIQQDFDCKLFRIQHNPYILDDDINSIVTDAEKKDPSIREQVRNWYSDEINRYSYPYSALACQQQNIGWNRNLSKKYLRFLQYILGANLLVIAFLFILLQRNWNEYDLNEYWNLGNIAVIFIKAIVSKTFSMTEQVRVQTEFLEQENPIFSDINNNDLNRIPDILYRIQNKIFEFRKNHKPIPDMFYRYHRWSEETNSRKRLIR